MNFIKNNCFTIIALFIFSIIVILTAISIPAYEDYVNNNDTIRIPVNEYCSRQTEQTLTQHQELPKSLKRMLLDSSMGMNF